MTIPATTRKAGPLLGNGSTTAFPFTFKVFAASDIKVTIADNLGTETVLVLNTNYTVTLNANQETSPGGTVTYPISGSALPLSSTLTIIGNLPYDQPLDLPSGGNFSPLALENELDRLTMQIQQLREQVGRAFTVPVNSSASTVLPMPEASTLIAWNENGTGLENYPVGDLATALAFATYRYDTFTGNGSTTQYTLSADPVTLGNLDVAVGGVTQIPGVDYTLSSGILAFTSAPPNGASILARFGEGIVAGPSMDSYDVRFKAQGTGAVERTAQSKMRDIVNVKDYGASTQTSATANAAAINAAIQANIGGEIIISETYSISSPINLNGFSGIIRFTGNGSGLQAATNNLKVFESTTNAYGCRIIDARILGTGYTGVYGFDLVQFQLRGAEIVRPVILDCEYGIYLRSLCWGLKIDHPETNNVDYPITLVEGCNAVEINHPSIDTFGVVGIWIKSIGSPLPNVGNLILNGFIQNGIEGIVDQGIQTQVIGTYFEGCSASDIALKTNSICFYGCATNHTSTGNRAYRGEAVDSAMIVHPYMSNSARTIGLFDFDGTCTNCYYDVIFGAGSINIPIGIVTGIQPISNKPGPIGGVTRNDGKFSTLSSTGVTEFVQSRTGSNPLTIATATPTTFLTIPGTGQYQICSFIGFSGSAADYTSTATVICDGNGARIIANNGVKLPITLSGLDVKVEQTSGINQTVQFLYSRLA